MSRPTNYLLNIPSPTEDLMKGFQTGVALRQQRERAIQQSQQRERALEMQRDLASLASNPRATGEDFSRAMIKYPEISEDFKRSFEVLNESQKQSKLNQMSQVFSALHSGNTDVAKNLLETEKQAALNSGLDREAQKLDVMIKQIELNPDSAKLSVRMGLSSIMGPDKFAKTFESLEQKDDYRILTNKEKKDLGLDIKKSFQVSEKGKITSIGGSGVSVNIDTKGKTGPIPAGFMLKEDKNTGEFTMEPIPGSPADKKLKELAKKKIETVKLKERALNVVTEDIGRLRNKIKTAPFFSPVAGALSGKILPNIRQNRVDAEKLKGTIASNIGFDRLQQMRDASPTGGALGQVSDRELSTLQSVLGSIDLDQSEKQLLKNLDRLETIYNKILKKAQAYPNAEKFGFGMSVEHKEDNGLSVKVSEIETRLNRRLTSDEIQFLRDREQ